MLPLDDPRWIALQDAYGSAARIPTLLRDAQGLPEIRSAQSERYHSLFSALCHQGDIYTASYAALPHLTSIIEANKDRFVWEILALVQAIESVRLESRGPDIPTFLSDEYFAAVRRVPTMSAALMTTERSELECRVLLSACATACGHRELADAINELTPDAIEELNALVMS